MTDNNDNNDKNENGNKDQSNEKDIFELINDAASEINSLYKNINDRLDKINKYKSKIPLKGESFDDYKFYLGLIENLIFYYKKSREIRLNKLSRDLKQHCKEIKLNEILPYDIFFSLENIQKMINAFKEKKKTNSNDLILNKNKYYWMKDIDVNQYEEWPKRLYYLLIYHKLVINFLNNSLNIEHNFLKAKKTDTINFKDKDFNMKSLEIYNMEYINTILDDPEIKQHNITDGWFQSKNKETIKELQKEKDTLKLTLDNRNSEFEKEKNQLINEFNIKKELEINELKSSINVILDEYNQNQNQNQDQDSDLDQGQDQEQDQDQEQEQDQDQNQDTDINLLIQKIREKLN